MNAYNPCDEHYANAQAAIEKALAHLDGCSDEERRALEREFHELRAMSEKLARGRVDIVIFGEINTGKSALINALIGKAVAKSNVLGGETKAAGHWAWEKFGYRVPGFAESEVRLVDTPGINEVDGAERARMAEEAARKADLILFVTDSDLNEAEYSALRQLKATDRPVLLVFNKVDLYSRDDRAKLRQAFVRRLEGLIAPEDIVEVAADPREREYILLGADGSERSEWRKPPPNVDALRERALAIFERDGKALVALNASLFAADRNDRIAVIKVRLRNAYAEKTILGYAALKGVAIAVNPIPLADILGGTAFDVAMVVHLGQLYGIPITERNALDLVKSIGIAAGTMVGIEYLTHVAASLLKGATFGVSTAVTAIPQGVVGAFGSYIVGHAARRYFEQGASWGDGGPKRVVEQILQSTDRDSVMASLREAILAKLRQNPHAARQ